MLDSNKLAALFCPTVFAVCVGNSNSGILPLIRIFEIIVALLVNELTAVRLSLTPLACKILLMILLFTITPGVTIALLTPTIEVNV